MRKTVLTAALCVMAAALGLAGEASSSEKPILTVSGKVSANGGTVDFDRDALVSMGMVSFETKTPWYDSRTKFEGVPLDKLMEKVGANGDHVTVIALNDYSSEIPIADFSKYHPILALKRDGEYMAVDDKGPLFIVYPFDSDPTLQTQVFYGRSVWQVREIVVD